MKRRVMAVCSLIGLLMTFSVQAQWVEEAKNIGLEHVHIEPRLIGAGAAVFDFNNDGYEDLYLTGGNRQDWLFINDKSGGFERASLDELVLATRAVTTIGVSSGDINNDGWMDIFITTDENSSNILLQNIGNGHFRNISNSAGILEKAWSVSPAFADFNADGFLDVYVTNYIKTPKPILDSDGNVVGFDHECYQDYLYINNGDLTFTESAVSLGVEFKGCGLAVAPTDVNDDGYTDIYVANDFGEWVLPNVLYQFDPQTGVFFENASNYQLDDAFYAMGIANGDIDNNGIKDYYVTNIGQNGFFKDSHQSYSREEEAYRIEHSELSEGRSSVSWGALNEDVNNDGLQDLLLANGLVGAADFLNVSEKDPNTIYMNFEGESFIPSAEFVDIDSLQRSRGVVAFDQDLDGDLDVLFTNVVTVTPSQGNVHFYRNNLDDLGNFLEIRLRGLDGEINQMGSSVFAYSNGKLLTSKELMTAGTHVSSTSDRLHLGLGQVNAIDSIVVHWVGGDSDKYLDIEVNQRVQLKKNSADFQVLGCTDRNALNYNDSANADDGTCEIVTSLHSNTSKEVLNIYPNPAQDYLFIEFGSNPPIDAQFTLIDLNGKVVKKAKLMPGLNRISVANLEGLYLARVIIDHDQITVQKVFIVNK